MIKFGICLLLAQQILSNAYLLYLHKNVVPVPTFSRVIALYIPWIIYLIIPGFIYLMLTKVPDVLKRSAGIRRQAIHIADWWMAFGVWQFVGRSLGIGALIALFAIGTVIIALSVRDAIQVEA